MYVNDLFKKYQKEVLVKTNKKDYYKSLFAETELFDISNFQVNLNGVWVNDKENAGEYLDGTLELNDFNLPFENCFVKVFDKDLNETLSVISYIFLNEDSPNSISGDIICNFKSIEEKDKIIIKECKLPFKIIIKENSCNYIIDKNAFNFYVNKYVENSDFKYFENNISGIEKQIAEITNSENNLSDDILEKLNHIKETKSKMYENLKQNKTESYSSHKKLFEIQALVSLNRVQLAFEQLSK